MDQVLLTADGRRMLQERLRELAEDVLPGMRPLLVEEERDERVVADFERLQAEHDRLAITLGTSGNLVPPLPDEPIGLGSRVAVSDAEGNRRVVRIVDPVEAFLDEERISSSSPLARALLGLRLGESNDVRAPAGVWRTTVLAVGEEI